MQSFQSEREMEAHSVFIIYITSKEMGIFATADCFKLKTIQIIHEMRRIDTQLCVQVCWHFHLATANVHWTNQKAMCFSFSLSILDNRE